MFRKRLKFATLHPMELRDTIRNFVNAGATHLVRGGRRADRLVGTDGRDHLLGGAGPDRLVGRGGDDCLDGGPGRDVLDCGRGEDIAFVGRGDRVKGCERLVRRS